MPPSLQEALASIDEALEKTRAELRASEGLQEKYRTLHHLRNEQLRASTAPPEIMSRIFQLALAADWFGVNDDLPLNAHKRSLDVTVPLSTLLACAQVCQHWRCVALGDCFLWSRNIDFTRQSRGHVKTMFDRAGEGREELWVNVDASTFRTGVRDLEELRRRGVALSTLRIVGAVGIPLTDTERGVTWHRTPLQDKLRKALTKPCTLLGLQALIINGTSPSDRFELPQKPLFGKQSWEYMYLTSLTLTNCTDPNWNSLLPSRCVANLVDLTLEEITCETTGTLGSFIALLRRSPKLQTLRLMGLSFHMDAALRFLDWELTRGRALTAANEARRQESMASSEQLLLDLPVLKERWKAANEVCQRGKPSEQFLLDLPALKQVSISYPCRARHGWDVDSYMALHLASIMKIPTSCRMELIFPYEVDSDALPQLYALPQFWTLPKPDKEAILHPGEKAIPPPDEEDIPLLKYGLRIWNNAEFHFFDLYTMDGEVGRDNFATTSRFRVRQDTSATKDLDNVFYHHKHHLPLSQIVDFELDADPELHPTWGLGLRHWAGFLKGASALKVIRIPKSLALAVYALRHTTTSLTKMVLTDVEVDLRLETALRSRNWKGELHPDFGLVLRNCTVAKELVASLRTLTKVTWDDGEESQIWDGFKNSRTEHYDAYKYSEVEGSDSEEDEGDAESEGDEAEIMVGEQDEEEDKGNDGGEGAGDDEADELSQG
ncbi:hypothetical protein C8R46DRAFT_1354323 [Mycena filopes]|nr:hypothetical protein C8R46DRAFT_1354323 [Mycena filopes]